MTTDTEIARTPAALATERGPDKTCCRSEATRRFAPDDRRRLMPRIRDLAATLPLRATQGGNPDDPITAHGPIRPSRCPR